MKKPETDVLQQIRTIGGVIFGSVPQTRPSVKSPSLKIWLLVIVFLMFIALFSRRDHDLTGSSFYTGCDLSGAIKDCERLMAESIASGRVSHNLPYEKHSGPTRDDQIKALWAQSEVKNTEQSNIRSQQLLDESDARYRAEYKRRGVKD